MIKAPIAWCVPKLCEKYTRLVLLVIKGIREPGNFSPNLTAMRDVQCLPRWHKTFRWSSSDPMVPWCQRLHLFIFIKQMNLMGFGAVIFAIMHSHIEVLGISSHLDSRIV